MRVTGWHGHDTDAPLCVSTLSVPNLMFRNFKFFGYPVNTPPAPMVGQAVLAWHYDDKRGRLSYQWGEHKSRCQRQPNL